MADALIVFPSHLAATFERQPGSQWFDFVCHYTPRVVQAYSLGDQLLSLRTGTARWEDPLLE